MTKFYDHDLATVHQAGFTRYANISVEWLIQELNQQWPGHQPEQLAPIVDLGCGDGTLSGQLSNKGYPTVGVDFSESMLMLARQQFPKAQWQQASVWKFLLPKCSAVAAVGEILNYLADGESSPENMVRLFQHAWERLVPGGIFLFDLAGPGRSAGKGSRYFLEEADWALLLKVREDLDSMLFTRDIILFKREGQLYRRSQETHQLRLYDLDWVEEQLRATGFEVQSFGEYLKEPLPAGMKVLLARKPAETSLSC